MEIIEQSMLWAKGHLWQGGLALGGGLLLMAAASIAKSGQLRQFGQGPEAPHRQAYARSDRWNGKEFQNYSLTTMDAGLMAMPSLIAEFFRNREHRTPPRPLPVQPLSPQAFAKDGKPKFAWYGHSALLLQLSGKNLLIDPMLGPDASPIGPIRTRRFSENTLSLIDALPPIDAVLLTHDHYDHLDLESIAKLRGKVGRWFVALGVGRHLQAWGVPADRIREFDWWETFQCDELQLVFTPSRHFSGRGLTDRNTGLWGGWVIAAPDFRVYWSGDGGYDTHFAQVGHKYGPFDWGFMECGQYHERWRQIHLFPEEAVQAAADARVQTAVPVHWGGFALALHSWTDPIERFVAEAGRKQQSILTPRLGEVVLPGSDSREAWWLQR